jgi:hypothetical protein
MTATPVFGAPEGWDAFLLARRRGEFAGPVVHVTRDDARMARLAEALAFVAPEAEVLRFPAPILHWCRSASPRWRACWRSRPDRASC